MRMLTKNWIEDAISVTVTSGDGTKGLLYDRDANTSWASVGSSDGDIETITISFSAGWSNLKTISRMLIRSHNLKVFSAYYLDSLGAPQAFVPAINETTNTDTDNFYEFAEVETNGLVFLCSHTHTPDDQKEIGELLFADEWVEIEEDWLPDSHEPSQMTKRHEHEKSDGGCLIVYESTQPKFRSAYSWESIPLSLVNDLYELYLRRSTFWIIPDEGNYNQAYYVNWVNDWTFKKTLAWTPSGERCYSGFLEVKAV